MKSLVPAFRGDDVEDILAEIAALVGASTDWTLVGNMREARGAAALASGRLADAAVEYRTAAELNASVNGTDERMFAAHASFWGGDTVEAYGRTRCDRLIRLPCPRRSRRVGRRSVPAWLPSKVGEPSRLRCTAMPSVAGATWVLSSTRR